MLHVPCSWEQRTALAGGAALAAHCNEEAAPQADQSLTWQSTGHGWVLHSWDRARAGHAAPACLAETNTERVDVCTPPPHFLEQTLQAVHESTTQCTGQAFVPHACDWRKDGQLAPPCAGCTVMGRVRD